MKIIGCDFHPSFQQIAMVDLQTGEYTERRLTPDEARQFYAELKGPVLVGMEACGNTLWLERLLAWLGIELWLGDAGKIRAMEVRKQKTDRRDAQLLLQLLLEKRFPKVWVPSVQQRDVRQLLLHRHKLVQMRRQVKNELQHLALNQGLQQKRKLWSAAGRQRLEELPLTGWTKQRREEELELLDELDCRIAKLDIAVQQGGANPILIYYGNGAGVFTAASTSPVATGLTANDGDVVTGDFNGDGLPDLAIASNSFASNVSVPHPVAPNKDSDAFAVLLAVQLRSASISPAVV